MKTSGKNFRISGPLLISTAIMALSALAAGCSDTTGSSLTCHDAMDCPAGTYCDLDAGKCVVGQPPDWEGPGTNNGTGNGTNNGTNNGTGTGDGTEQPDLPGDSSEVNWPEGRQPCRYVPQPGEFSPQLECHWTRGSTYAAYDDVVMTPAVANLTDDNGDGAIDTKDIPDVVFLSYRLQEDGCCNTPAVLRIIQGRCGEDGNPVEVASTFIPTSDPSGGIDNSSGVAIGDVDGDGLPEIIAMSRRGWTLCFDNTGTLKWESPYPLSQDYYTAGQPSIDDLDGDGIGEIIIGRTVLSGLDGSLKWRSQGGLGINGFMGPISFAADIDLDGRKEVVAGNTVYAPDGSPIWTFDFPSASSSCGGSMPCDGFDAVGNFDQDPQAEVVIVRQGDVWIVNDDGSLLAHFVIPVDDCSRNEGGPPTVADFDGDGQPEVGVAGADFYTVYDLECCDTLPDCLNIPADATQCSEPGVRWNVPNNDCSSRVTGSSVFDFDGDGQAEVVYNDERLFRIFSGVDGEILYEEPNCSHTRLEYPIIADVDNDGNAEIVFIENNWGAGCGNGLEIWGDAADRWVPTRRIWNQHAYYITNITEDGHLTGPDRTPNWLIYNNFRQNMPDYDVFAAPDLTIRDMEVDRSSCPGAMTVRVTVCNDGDLRVGQGTEVHLWDGSGSELSCSPLLTTVTLEPDDCETLQCSVTSPPESPSVLEVHACVDSTDFSCAGPGTNHECHEDNNTADASAQGCDAGPG